MYSLIMVCNSCVYFLQKFRASGFSKDDLCANRERTKLAGGFGRTKATVISPMDVWVWQSYIL